MDKNKQILSDSDILELTELAPMTEGSGLEDFIAEARIAAEAIKKTGVSLDRMKGRARALFLMRAFYFLGHLRGCESYRQALDDIGADPAPVAPFCLDDSCADVFSEDLKAAPDETLAVICKIIGL